MYIHHLALQFCLRCVVVVSCRACGASPPLLGWSALRPSVILLKPGLSPVRLQPVGAALWAASSRNCARMCVHMC
jgi:hypothetical protein